MQLYQYPEKTKVSRVIPKNKFYQQGKANSKMEKRFVESVEKITWAYKLSSDTINLSTNDELKEVQIFRIDSRQADFDSSILAFIDRLILIPIIFEIHFGGKVKVMATYKRLSHADKSKAVIGQYYQSPWLDDTQRYDLPIFLNLADLYEFFIEQLLPLPDNIEAHSDAAKENIEDKIAKAEQIKALQKQIVQLEKRLQREKQFNRKVNINMQLQKLQQALQTITGNP